MRRPAYYWTKPSLSRTGGKSEWDKKGVLLAFFFPFVSICTNSFQATHSNIYQDKQIPHTLGLSGINRSETAGCSTCLEILVEFQE